jgi:ProP effector
MTAPPRCWPSAFRDVLRSTRRAGGRLKIGIHADITAPLGGAITWRELHNALCSYILIRGNLLSLRAGAERIDLDGNVAGVAIADEADHARAVLMRRRAKKAARAATAPVPSPQQPTSPQADGAAPQATDSISRGHYC